MSDNYEKRGVSFSKSDVHKAISNIDKGLESTAFCKIIPDLQDSNYGIILHADGAGTKSSLAWAYWKETGNMEVWKGIAQDALVMNIDDMICAGVESGFIISSTIGRNKRLVPGEVVSAIIQGTQELAEFLNSLGIDARTAGGETADVGDLVRTIIVDSTVFARIHKNKIIAARNIRPGDVIVGLASFGKSKYETYYNSGIGSNGLTSARHDVFCPSVRDKYPETFDPGIPGEVVYKGHYKLTDSSPVKDMDMGRFVLSPTRTYAPVMKEVFRQLRPQIHGLIHCTGGGQTKVLHFIENLHIVKDNLFPVPPLFDLIQRSAATDLKEMYSVFNMGHRLEIYLPEEFAEQVISISKSFDVDARIVGHCEAASNKSLTIRKGEQVFSW